YSFSFIPPGEMVNVYCSFEEFTNTGPAMSGVARLEYQVRESPANPLRKLWLTTNYEGYL
ncbi:MAG TPA: hypothetical protein VN920_02155, partial [Pyrinomonadaceae bacterium]|nr:hypothetical protein [Pyrinomonadaceae bacterium]